MIVNLGDSDEEKYVNILTIKKIRKKFSRVIGIIFLVAFLFIVLIALDSNKKAILPAGYVLLFTYICMAFIEGPGVAWFMFMAYRGDFHFPELEDVSDEEIFHNYIVGGKRLCCC